MSTDRYTLPELRQFIFGQVPSASPQEVERLALALLLLMRPAAPPPAARGQRRHPPERPAAERLKLKP